MVLNKNKWSSAIDLSKCMHQPVLVMISYRDDGSHDYEGDDVFCGHDPWSHSHLQTNGTTIEGQFSKCVKCTNGVSL